MVNFVQDDVNRVSETVAGPRYPALVAGPRHSQARAVLSLNGTWTFRVDSEDRGSRAGWSRGDEAFELELTVPGSVNAVTALADSYPSFQQPNGYQGTCWYQKRFDLDTCWAGEKVWLKIGGVIPTAHVWMNGVYMGFHDQPCIGVKFDATAAARPGSTNVVTIEGAWRDLDMRGGLVTGPCIYADVELERCSSLYIEELFIRPCMKTRTARISAQVHNDQSSAKRAEFAVQICERVSGACRGSARKVVELEANSVVAVSVDVPIEDARLWSDRDPFLYTATAELQHAGEVVDGVVERFGIRHLAVAGNRLLLNGEPFFWRAVADEFRMSPTLIPLTDDTLIRRRLEALQKAGFHGKRYHTHVPTQQELDLCDELGLLIWVEVPVISNFKEIKPWPNSHLAWINKLKEIRNHPSVVVYCMGNEGSQLLADEGYQERARVCYSDAKALAPDLLITPACGIQREFPQVPNDLETPHLWSRWYKWAFEGLTTIPWHGLKPLAQTAPLIIHEFGKYTVWPDPAEDEYFRRMDLPLRGNYGEMGRIALREAGLEHLLDRVIRNSRSLSFVCTKTLIEQTRRQAGVFGYQWHCAFRVGANRGFIDDLGYQIDPEFKDIVLSNPDTALLIDRDFRHRTLLSGEPVGLTCYLSHFGQRELSGTQLDWQVEDERGKPICSGTRGDLNFPRGENGALCSIEFITPAGSGAMTLTARLMSRDGDLITHNHWSFWRFPFPSRAIPDSIVIHFKDRLWELEFMAHFPTLRRLDDLFVNHTGFTCYGSDVGSFLNNGMVTTIISDHWDETLQQFVERGGNVLLLNTGRLPEHWIAKGPPVTVVSVDYCSTYNLFAPFRSGWDHGNQATVIEKHPALDGVPHEGWCDLQFYEMVEQAPSLRTKQLPGCPTSIIRVIPIWKRTGPQAGPGPETPDVERLYATEDRAYLAECAVGNGRLMVCTLRLTSDPAGRYVLERLIEFVDGAGRHPEMERR